MTCRHVLTASTLLALGAGLARADEPDGETIVVTGTRSETPKAASPVTTEVIDRKQLERSGVQTAAEALALRPGIWMDRGVAGTQGISMQGLGPQYTLILVDGVRQIGRTDGTLDLDRFGVEDLEQIEIVRGPSSVLYGSDALGGVVNLITRTPREGFAADALARVDGRLGYEARARIAGGKRGTTGALVGTVRHGAAVELGGESPATIFDAYDDQRATAHVRHLRGEAWRFDANGEYLRRDLEGVDAMATGAVFDRRNLIETATGQVAGAWTGDTSAVRLELDASTYRDQYLDDQRKSDALDTYQETTEGLLQASSQGTHQFGDHRVLVGLEGMHESLVSERLAKDGSRQRGAVYAQDEWRIGESGDVLVVPAARLDLDTQFGSHLTPRLAARWQATAKLVTRGSVGMGYRAPGFKELLLHFANPGVGYVVDGNPDLTPETSTSVQGGAEWRVTPWLWVSGDAYLNRLHDMIYAVTRPNSADGMLEFSYANIGRARTAGAEASAIAGTGRGSVELAYALNRARDLDEDRLLESIPQHRATLAVRWQDPNGFEAFAAAVFTGHRPLYLDEDPQVATITPRRIEIRARVAARFSKALGGFLGVDNLLDAGDPTLDRIPPRTIYAGLEAHR